MKDCSELFRHKDEIGRKRVQFSNFDLLHPDGRRLIKNWYHRARERSHEGDFGEFEAFIFLWISFNGWASCVARENRDAFWIEMLCADTQLNKLFDDFLTEDTEFYSSVIDFSEFWPIFSVVDLRERRIVPSNHDHRSRKELTSYYLENGAARYQPACWKRHALVNEACPLTWPHVLKAIYTVRCNLFHGEKGRHSEMDRKIVIGAFSVLLMFFERVLDART